MKEITGSHALALFGPSAPEIFVDMQNALSSGHAEDHVKIVLKAQGAPTIDVELSSACAYPQDRWLVMGTAGGLTGTTSQLRWKWVDWSRMPERPVEQGPTPDHGYNRETLDWLEDSWEDKNDGLPGERYFYQDLYATLRQGKPLIITPESVRRQIAVIEACLERSSG